MAIMRSCPSGENRRARIDAVRRLGVLLGLVGMLASALIPTMAVACAGDRMSTVAMLLASDPQQAVAQGDPCAAPGECGFDAEFAADATLPTPPGWPVGGDVGGVQPAAAQTGGDHAVAPRRRPPRAMPAF
jgi:hypothetical protein